MHNDGSEPARWYSTNLVGVPAPVLGSAAFNAHPQPLHVAGTREAHAGLATAAGAAYVETVGLLDLDVDTPDDLLLVEAIRPEALHVH